MAKGKKKRSKRAQTLLRYMLTFTVVIIGLFSLFTVLTLKSHLKEKEIRDVRKYTMSVIWSCFSTYRVKQDMAYLG